MATCDGVDRSRRERVALVVEGGARARDGAGGARGSRRRAWWVGDDAAGETTSPRRSGGPRRDTWSGQRAREGCKVNEGDWVQCKSVTHFTTAVRFSDVQDDSYTASLPYSCYRGEIPAAGKFWNPTKQVSRRARETKSKS